MRILSLFICLATVFSLHAKSTICLNMIVKDESLVIREALDSIKPYIDHWVIVDTGSTDGTQDIIREHMKEIPGELYERPWVDFAHNRNEALKLAKDKADYLFWLDGDDWVETDNNFGFSSLEEDAYLVKVKGKSCEFYRYHLLKSTLPWKWEGVLHECIICDTIFSSAILEKITYRFSREDIREKPQDYYKKQVAILEEALKEEPDNSRYIFYLAQSYREAGDFAKALEWYQKRVDIGGWNEEVFFALLQCAKLKKALHADNDTIIESFNKAHRCRPHRLEPIYYLAEIYNDRREFALAYECLKGAQFLPKLAEPDVLLRETWIEEWGLPYQLSICANYLGQYRESLTTSNNLLAIKDLPASARKEVELNQHLSLQKMQENSISIPISIEEGTTEEETKEKISQQIADIIKAKIQESISLKQP